MIKIFFLVTLRALKKHLHYSLINILGLSIGLGCTVFIGLWVWDELSWDGFHKKYERIYQVYLNTHSAHGVSSDKPMPIPLAEELAKLPAVESAVPVDWGGDHLLTYHDKRTYKKGYHVGDDFLEAFTFPLLQGTSTALHDPSSIIITRSTAESLFGAEDPLNKIIRLDNAIDLTVAGVIEDPPSNSTFTFDCLIPFSTLINTQDWARNAQDDWGYRAIRVFIVLKEETNVENFSQLIKNILQQHQPGQKIKLALQPLSQWRLYNDFENGKPSGGLITYVRAFSLIGIFILLIACINFINLATARAQRRAMEVGIRKSVGSSRKQLILQFLSETVLLAAMSFCVTIIFVQLLLPAFNSLVVKNLSIEYKSPLFWTLAAAVVMLTGLLAGSYPAFYLSSFNPVEVLKGNRVVGKDSFFRKGLVILQFFISASLIIMTLVIYSQIEFLRNRPLGYEQENLISMSANQSLLANYDVIRNELTNKNLASDVCLSSTPVTNLWSYAYTSNGNVEWAGKDTDDLNLAIVSTTYDYTTTMGIKMIEGRDFSREFNDSSSIIINARAVEYMKLNNPLGQKIRWFGRELTIIGVTENVVMKSPHEQVDPLVMLFEPGNTRHINIRLSNSNNQSSTLQKIQSAIQKYSPEYPISYSFASEQFEQKFSEFDRIGKVSNIFSCLAIVISCMGLFGLLSFVTDQRKREVGIRKVLGASVTNIVTLLTKDLSQLILIAFIVAGFASYWAADAWLTQYYYRIAITPGLFLYAAIILFLVSFSTVIFQTLRAAGSDPVKTLRSE
jgi:putative ABC transport system permease protein